MAGRLDHALKHAPLRAPAPLFDRPRAPRGVFTSQTGFLRALGGLAVVLLLVLPFMDASRYTMSIATSALIYVMLCMGLNVVVGFAGLLDLGYIAFFAVGAYVSGIFTTVLGFPMWLALIATICACVIAGIIIGAPTLRLRSDYLAIVTLGFGEIIRITANNLEITGGPSGIHGIPSWEFGEWSFDDGFSIGGIEFPGYVVFYYFVALVVVVVGVIGAGRLGKGKMGRAWKAVRDDEDAAEAMGINTYVAKISAYIIGAVWAGMAGQLMATHLSAISPNSFQFLYSALILMAVVLGGMGSTPGVIIGALFVSLAPELLRDFAEWRFLIFGVLLVVVMLFRPAGLWPATAVLPWLKRQKPQPPPFTSAVSAVDSGEPVVPPSVMESVDGLPATDAEEGRQP